MAGIQQCTHGANPTAEETPEEKCKDDKDESRPHKQYQCFGGQGGTGSKERIDPEKDVYCILEFIGTGIIGFNKKKKKQDKAEYLTQSTPVSQFETFSLH
jgi:hypothetical protein